MRLATFICFNFKLMKNYFYLFLLIILFGCLQSREKETSVLNEITTASDSSLPALAAPDVIVAEKDSSSVLLTFKDSIDSKNVNPAALVGFAQKWMDVKYKYASSDPAEGFDCSGFISFVFNHFNIAVPRSSVEFTNKGLAIRELQAQPGDLILFTGTDSTIRIVGHMGIIVSNTDSLRFIHSSSGRANGVTITALNNYYRGRFVSVRRIFK